MSTMKIAGDMVEAIRRRLAPAGLRINNEIHDTDILMSINLAKDMVYEELLSRAPDRYIEKDTTLTTTADEPEYAWGSSWKSVQLVRVATDDPNAPRSFQGVSAGDLLFEGNISPGYTFYRVKDKLVLNPTPGDTGKTITVYYFKLLDDLVKMSTELTMPQGMIDLVMIRATLDIAGTWGLASIATTAQMLYSQQLAAALKGIESAREHTGIKYSMEALREGVYDDSFSR